MTRTEWLEWRKQGIGGSDAPIIMGVSPHKTLLMLYEDKVSDVVEEETSWIQERGHRMESRILSLFELRYGKSFKPDLFVMSEFPHIRVSLDGISEDNKEIVEVKLSGRKDWDLAGEGKVPEHYWPQVQHELMVTGAQVCWYISYLYGSEQNKNSLSFESLHVVPVTSDKEYQKKLFEAETEFWFRHVVKRKPPLPTDKDYVPLTGFAKLANRYKALDDKIADLKAEQEAIREALQREAEARKHTRFLCAGIRIRKESRQGNVQYAKIPELQGVDLDRYRGKGSTYWKFEIIKEKKKKEG